MSSESLKIKLQNLQTSLEQLNKNESKKISSYVIKTHYLDLKQIIQNLCISLLSEEELKLLFVCCREYIDSVYILATKLNPCQYSKNNYIIEGLLNILAVTAELLDDLRTDFIEYLAPAVFLKLESMEPPWFFKILMKTFKQCLQHTIRKKRHKIFIDNLNKFFKLADIICYCGDHSYQATLIEILFCMGSSEQIKQYAGDFFSKSNELKIALLNVQLNNFDVHLRALQNSINIKFKTIYSIKCASVFLDNYAVTEPEDVDMWVDFNIEFDSISFYCDRNCLLLDTFDKNQEDGWETVTVMVDSVSSVKSSSWKSKDKMSVIGKIIRFILKTPCHCNYQSSYQAKEHLTLMLLESSELKELELKILPQMFGEKYNNTENPEDFSKGCNLDCSIIDTRRMYNSLKISHPRFIVNSSKNDVLDNKLNDENITRSDSRPSLSVYSSSYSSILSDSDSANKFHNLSSRAASNDYCKTYSKNKTNLSSQLIRESAEFHYESSVSEEFDNLINNETFKDKNNLLKTNASEICNSNLSHLKCSAIIDHNQNLSWNTSPEDDYLLFSKPRDAKSKLLRPIPTYKTNRSGPVDRVSVNDSNLWKRKTRTPLPTVSTPLREINEKISKSKILGNEGNIRRGKKSIYSKDCFDSLSSTNSITLWLQNDLVAKNVLNERDQKDLRYKFVPRITHDDDDVNVTLPRLSKLINSTSAGLINNNNNNKLEDIKIALEQTTISIDKICRPQKFEKIPNEVQMNEMSLSSPIISTTNIETQHSISYKETTDNTEINKITANENGIMENIVEVNNNLKCCSTNTIVNKKITSLLKTMKPCKVNIIKEDLVKKLNQIKKKQGEFPNYKIQDKTVTHATQYFSKKRKYEGNVKTEGKTDIKRPKVNIISNITIKASGNENSSLKKIGKAKVRMLCDINDLSYLKEPSLQKKESNLNITVSTTNKKENKVLISEVYNLNQDSSFNTQKCKTILQKECYSSIKKEERRRKCDEILNEILNSEYEIPKPSTPYWCKSKKMKKVPAHKLETNVKRTKKTTRKTKKDFDYSEKIKVNDSKINSSTLNRCNRSRFRDMKQYVDMDEHVGIEPATEWDNKKLDTNISDTANNMNCTEEIDVMSCVDMETIKSWIATDCTEYKEEIFEKMENVLKFTTDVTKEALEILKGGIPPHRKVLYDSINFINAHLENYFKKCNSGEIKGEDIEDTNFIGNI